MRSLSTEVWETQRPQFSQTRPLLYPHPPSLLHHFHLLSVYVNFHLSLPLSSHPYFHPNTYLNFSIHEASFILSSNVH